MFPLSFRYALGVFTPRNAASPFTRTSSASSLLERLFIVDLLAKIEDFNESSRDRRLVESEVLRLRQARCGPESLPVVRQLCQYLTPYATKLVLQQEAQAMQYKIVDSTEARVSAATDSFRKLN